MGLDLNESISSMKEQILSFQSTPYFGSDSDAREATSFFQKLSLEKWWL